MVRPAPRTAAKVASNSLTILVALSPCCAKISAASAASKRSIPNRLALLITPSSIFSISVKLRVAKTPRIRAKALSNLIAAPAASRKAVATWKIMAEAPANCATVRTAVPKPRNLLLVPGKKRLSKGTRSSPRPRKAA